MSNIEPLYTTIVTATGGREGHARSDDGVLDVQLRRPKVRGIADGTNPEQLFAAAWAGCWQQALIAIARQQGLDASGSVVKVEITQGKDPKGNFGLAAKIDIQVPDVDDQKARELADAANERCVYSRSVRGNVSIEISAKGA